MRRLAARLSSVALALLIVGTAGAGPGAYRPDQPGGWIHQTAWSADGRWIAYVPGDGPIQLTTVRADGSGHERSTPGFFGLAHWAPDGSRYALEELGDGIFLADPDGGRPTRLTTGRLPRWSPDGRSILFVRRETGDNWSIRAFDVDSAAERELVSGRVYQPRWSPDGSEVLYVAALPGDGCRTEIRVVSADGSATRTVIAASGEGRSGAAWSPDGRRIAYVTFCHPAHAPGPRAAYVANADGSGERLLGVRPGLDGVRWSPRGDWIALLGSTSLVPGFTLAEVDGPRRFDFQGRNSRDYVWSPEGTAIAYEGPEGLTVGFTDGSKRVVGGWGGDWSPDGRAVSFEVDPYLEPTTFLSCGRQLQTLELSSGVRRGHSICQLEGSIYADQIGGTAGPDLIYALPGADRIEAGDGADTVWAGHGRDLVVGGPGADRLSGGQANDRIDARDGVRDQVSCGPGRRDMAQVDPFDAVSGNCERVLPG